MYGIFQFGSGARSAGTRTKVRVGAQCMLGMSIARGLRFSLSNASVEARPHYDDSFLSGRTRGSSRISMHPNRGTCDRDARGRLVMLTKIL